MKLLITLATLVVATYAIDKEFVQELRQKLRSHVEACAKEVNAGPDDVSAIFAHKLPATHEGKCIFFCMHKLYNAQNEDGSLNMAGALANLELIKDMDPDVYTKVSTSFKNCESAPFDSDPCLYAANLVTCIVKEGRAVGLDEVLVE
ncbi:odorant binding protein 12 [Tribolium castaneum]|uniref:Odorant binding protein 12 n=2 Tax=Tribolium castaneum TaxID=7070 RepID=D2A1G6_TRICA|nr:PREDICTED: uncharacterized protein LOC657484 [Tribolium castaneum]EFA02857.1 odorant binding protein 12 [Tribolium castaneum]|eukprot:XP_969035.3 PREDICTED: uncharacterized protein LOC657484 [Tribolium castaneum]